jgi:hypothetical protein
VENELSDSLTWVPMSLVAAEVVVVVVVVAVATVAAM